jgi:hypothetical protein
MVTPFTTPNAGRLEHRVRFVCCSSASACVMRRTKMSSSSQITDVRAARAPHVAGPQSHHDEVQDASRQATPATGSGCDHRREDPPHRLEYSVRPVVSYGVHLRTCGAHPPDRADEQLSMRSNASSRSQKPTGKQSASIGSAIAMRRFR